MVLEQRIPVVQSRVARVLMEHSRLQAMEKEHQQAHVQDVQLPLNVAHTHYTEELLQGVLQLQMPHAHARRTRRVSPILGVMLLGI